MSFIPWSAGQFFGRKLGKLLSRLPMDRIMISQDNLQTIFGEEKKRSELIELNQRVLMHFAQFFFEIPHILRLKSNNLAKYVVFDQEENLFSALRKKKGVIILTAHFGNWELASAAIRLHTKENFTVVARPIDFLPADQLVTTIRTRCGTEIIPKKRSMRIILKALRANKCVGILLDQNVDWYDGVFVPFMGKTACTNKGLALIALKTKVPVIPLFSIKQPDGRYRIIFEKEMELVRSGDNIKDIEANTKRFTAKIESYVKQYPEQWFWFHRRWKTKSYDPIPTDFYKN